MDVTFLLIALLIPNLADSQKQGQVCRRTSHQPEEENEQKCPRVQYITSDDDEGEAGEKGAKGARGRNGDDIRLSIDDIVDRSILNRLIDEELKKYNWRIVDFSQNIDECALKAHNCSIDATCKDTLESFTCSCNAGYSGDGFVCEDIDECASDAHTNTSCNTNAVCRNTQGGFACECKTGYSGDGNICTAPVFDATCSTQSRASTFSRYNEFKVNCPSGCAHTNYSVWGIDIYTDDSSICRAAIHYGRIYNNGGIVLVQKLPGRSSYGGNTRYSITSTSYGSWSGSFSVNQV